jgi:hypothetical protein
VGRLERRLRKLERWAETSGLAKLEAREQREIQAVVQRWGHLLSHTCALPQIH